MRVDLPAIRSHKLETFDNFDDGDSPNLALNQLAAGINGAMT